MIVRVLAKIAMLAVLAHLQAASAQDAASNGAAGLVPLPDARARLAKIMPGADWSKFRTVEITTLQIPLEVRDAKPPGASTRFTESYVLRDKDVAKLQDAYMNAMRDQLSKAGYQVVTAAGADTLIVAAQIMKIRLSAPIESSRMGYAGRSTTYSKNAGYMMIGAVLADGGSSEVLAQVVDQNYPADVWGVNNSVTNFAEAKRAFNRWASALSDRLRSLRGAIN
jgi:hypothetical protein